MISELIIEQQASSGARNMAIDEALLTQANERRLATFRLYRWKTPTVSLGYFQSRSASRQIPDRFASLPVVRRLSGGGAILHDRELTYSCVLPKDHPWGRDPGSLYNRIHLLLIECLGTLGFACRLRRDLDSGEEPFLCFQRQHRTDVVFQGTKVIGSAQRRRKGAILQHGSLLLETSPLAPELPGLRNLSNSSLGFQHLWDGLQELIEQQFDSAITLNEPHQSLLSLIEQLKERVVIDCESPLY